MCSDGAPEHMEHAIPRIEPPSLPLPAAVANQHFGQEPRNKILVSLFARGHASTGGLRSSANSSTTALGMANP